MNISNDLDRFKRVLKNRIRDNLRDFIVDEQITSQKDKSVIRIPLKRIDIPRFRFGSKEQGGNGMGDGDNGDPISGSGKGSGKGKAGDEASEHEFTADFEPDELANIIKEELKLPELEDKGKGNISQEKSKYNKISSTGNESLRHFKRTFKEALKRDISTGTYNPDDPKIIPIKSDKRYRNFSTQEIPEINAVSIFIMDVSASMDNNIKQLAKTQTFWIDLLLRSTYKKMETVFIIHDTEAKEVSRDEFFQVSTSGGTHISSAYDLCSKIIRERFPFDSWNSYIYQFSDSDNSRGDNETAIKILKDDIVPECNRFCFGEICNNGGGTFTDYVEANLGGQVKISRVNKSSDILNSIKKFFE